MGTNDAVRTDQGSGRTAVAVLLSLTGLFTLALTQPLLDLIGRNAAFVVASNLRGAGLVALTLALVFGVPLGLGALVLIVRGMHRPTGAALHDLLVGLLVAAAVLVILRVAGAGAALPAAAELLIASGAGIAAGILFRRSATLRRVVGYTALAAPVVVVLFLFLTPVRGLLATDASGEVPAANVADATPVVLVVFDELPLATLLDADHAVDATAFPAFAELASDATFFRNATASHSSTTEALPALLSGRYVRPNTLPIGSAHPTNLFSVLSGRYQPHAVEPLTQLCTGTRCRGGGGRGGPGTNLGIVLRDLGIVGLHLLVPDDWAEALPAIDASWGNFGRPGIEEEAARPGAGTGVLRENTPAEFRRFVRQIRPEIRPTLHVLHTLLPHRPWRYLPDGRMHTGDGEPSLGPEGWTDDPWPVAQSYQLHLAQTQLADRLLGGLLKRLQARGMYDRTLVIVAADHGMSLLPGTPPRTVTTETVGEIAPVPLFVKLPGQATGTVSDAAVETVDIAPTVLDVVGAQAPQGLDGRSLLDPDAAAREDRQLYDVVGEPWPVGASQAPLFESVQRKIDLFGAGTDYDLYGLTPPGSPDLLGRRVGRAPAIDGLTVELRRPAAFRRVDLASRVIPALLLGRITGDPAPGTTIALAVNGRVAAITRLAEDGAFRALLPPDSLRDGANAVTVLLLGPNGRLATIAPVQTP